MINTLRERLAELSPRDTFELGMYRLFAWSQSDGRDSVYHADRLNDWADILEQLARDLRKAANR